METEGQHKSKLVHLLNAIPSWVQMLITLGTLLFGMGVMYATLQDVKVQVQALHNVPAINERQDADINNIKQSLIEEKNTRQQTNQYIGKLADAVSSLSTSVARLEGKLDNEDRRRK